MAPLPKPLSRPLPPGQMTIISTLGTGSALGLSRPPPNPRPGPKLKHQPMIETIRGRRLISGINKQRVLYQFAKYRLRANREGEASDTKLANRLIIEDDLDDLDNNKDDDNTTDYKPKHRYSYTREHKLIAIEYF